MTSDVTPDSGNGGEVRLRLKKSDKLRFRAQFEQIRRDGVRYAAPGLVAVVAPSPVNRLECGVICSRKYSLLSVVRNRARRLLWESFRVLKPEIAPCRLLLIPRRRMQDYRREEATAELAEMLRKSGVLLSGGGSPPQGSPSCSSASTRS